MCKNTLKYSNVYVMYVTDPAFSPDRSQNSMAFTFRYPFPSPAPLSVHIAGNRQPNSIPLASSSHLGVVPPPPPTRTPDHKLLITGGRQLSGHVHIEGSKNSALAVLAGTLCCSRGTSVVRGVPDISDTKAMVSILRSLGARVEVSDDDGVVEVDAGGIHSVEPSRDAVGKTRAGFFVVGPLLGRFGEAEIALPGGCEIGDRPVDFFISGLSALGAVIELRHGKVHARAANGRGLVGGRFHLDYPSVGATETLMMAASVAEGLTVLSNVAREPEVADLARFLVAGGADVQGAGTDTLVICGRKQLYGSEYSIIPDRIEAGTFMVAAAITRSCISLSPVISHHLTFVIDKLSAAGCKISQIGPDILEVSAVSKATGADLHGFDFKTLPYPGFPTDLQPLFMALLTTCNGLSIVEESVFERRMRHVEELQKLGAGIQVNGNTVFIIGSTLLGSQVVATDLRSGASLVVDGMAAQGLTEIIGVSHIDRGYENLDIKLRCLGADIRRELLDT